jgi:ribonuclease P protein component
MLARDNRLDPKDFSTLKRQGKISHSESFSISYRKRADKLPSRFGFVVSTKISTKATIRNKSKRALREGVRHITTIAKPGYDCVFLAKPVIVKKYTSELLEEVRTALTKIKVLQ